MNFHYKNALFIIYLAILSLFLSAADEINSMRMINSPTSNQLIEFVASSVKSQMIDPLPFKKPHIMHERLILLIKQNVYHTAKSFIHKYIQNLYDEGIDVRAYVIPVAQFRDNDRNWVPNAGIRLKNFIRAVYDQVKMNEISERQKRGLILLGSLPPIFCNWQQENKEVYIFEKSQSKKDLLERAEIKVVNDYANKQIKMFWESPPPDLNKIEHKLIEPTNCYIMVYEKIEEDGRYIEKEIERYLLDDKDPPIIYKPVFPDQQKTFSFKFIMLQNNNENILAEIKDVNWNFMVNACDYLYADIDGFQKNANSIYTYKVSENHFITAYPAIVVTHKVSDNNKRFELSSKENNIKKANEKFYAAGEMYYGRIDPQAIVNPAVNGYDEGTLIIKYLLLNHRWRKNVNDFRDNYQDIFIFRSGNFVGKPDEKEKIYDTWYHVYQNIISRSESDSGQKIPIDKIPFQYNPPEVFQWDMMKGITLFDAKRIVNVDKSDKEPTVTLYEENGCQGESLFFKKGDNDLTDNSPNWNDRAASIRIDFGGGSGGVILYKDIKFKGDRLKVMVDDPNLKDGSDLDLPDNWVGKVSSLQLKDAAYFKSPAWDCKTFLKNVFKSRSFRLVDLGVHGRANGFTLAKNENCTALNKVYSVDIKYLLGDIKFLINHCCDNGKFMKKDNAASHFLFDNQMLTQWCWAGSGTTEHHVLHQKLANGRRLGVAVLDNLHAQMTAKHANPWRSYFLNILGDPTLRVVYQLPDLVAESLEVNDLNGKLILMNTGNDAVSTMEFTNDGINFNGSPLRIIGKWFIWDDKGKKVKEDTFNIKIDHHLKPGETAERNFSFAGLKPGTYRVKVELDYLNVVTEINENNNDFETEFTLQEENIEMKMKRPFFFNLYLGGVSSKTREPIFISGEPNTETTRMEYGNPEGYSPVNRIKPTGGMSLEFYLNPMTAFEIGALYSEKSLRVTNDIKPDDEDITTLKTIALPAQFKLYFGKENFKYYLGIGLEGSYILSAKHRYTYKMGEEIYEEIFGDDSGKYGKKLVDLMKSRLVLSLMGTVGVKFKNIKLEGRIFSSLSDFRFNFSESTSYADVNAGKLKGIMILCGVSF